MLELPTPFIIATSFRLPGLGILVLPTLPEPSWLISYPLHTSLAITAPHDSQYFLVPFTGTIEEMQHDNSLPRRALLLDIDTDTTPLVSIHLHASEMHQS